MFDQILVPTDGSDCAEAAVGYAADLASRYGATVHALSIADSRVPEEVPADDAVREDRTELTHRACDDLSAAGVDTESAVRTGVPSQEILAYADEAGIDLVVMGTHGRTGVERYLLGSVTEKVVRLSEIPVLTVKEADDGAVTYPYEDVLVPTDGSEGAATAIDPALSIADTYGARLHALSVVDTMSMGVDVRSATVFDALDDAAQDAVETVAERAEQTSVPAETAVEYGPPHRGILDYVDEAGIDLVVMGTHGRSGVGRYLLGSIAEKTVRTSPVPVMTVRRPDAE